MDWPSERGLRIIKEMHQYTILLFGPSANAIGADRIQIDCDSELDAAALNQAIVEHNAKLEEPIRVGRLAVDNGFVSDTQVVDPRSEIALITMVSGG